jgi:RNA-directed DNA polymerase
MQGGAMSCAKSFNISKQEVMEAWRSVKSNRGSAGIDRESIEAFEGNLKDNLYKIWNRMSSGTYFPPPVRGVAIPKRSGGERILGIPTVSDRVAQVVVQRRLEEKLEPIFMPDSYGYRPGKSAADAISVTRERCWRQDWVLEFDIRGLFDNIRHDLLEKALSKHVTEKWILLYVRRWLRAPMRFSDNTQILREKGTPQGGCVSPVLSNLFLHYVFDAWMTRNHPRLKWCRYADDGLIHCASHAQAQFMKRELLKRLECCGLELNLEKTRIVYCADSNRKSQHDVTEFTFLGYTFRRRKTMNNKTGEIFDGFEPGVSKDAIRSMKRVIKNEWRLKSLAHLELKDIATRLNPVIRGWINYYRRFYEAALIPLARYINEHLRLWAIQKFESLRRRRVGSYDWLRKVYKTSPRLFAHWEVFRVY